MLLALIVATGLAAAPAPPIDATRIVCAPPSVGIEIDAGKLKGTLVRLAWSPDGTQVYLQTADPDTRGNVKLRHYTVGFDGQPPKSIDREPDWANAYWAWKSAQSAPGMSSLRISVDQQQKRVSSTSNPAGGDLAKGAVGGGGSAGSAGSGGGSAGGMSVGEAAGAAYQTQNANVVTMRLKGEVVGEFVNAPPLPGTTFGWGPTGSGLIVFTGAAGRLVLLDDQGRKQDIAGTRDGYVPAFTADGKKLAYLEKSGKKKFLLRVIDLAYPTS